MNENFGEVSAQTRDLLNRYERRARNSLLKQKEAALWKQHCATENPNEKKKALPKPRTYTRNSTTRHMPAYCMRSLQEHIRGFYRELGMFRADHTVQERFEVIPFPVASEPRALRPETRVEASKKCNPLPRRLPSGRFSPLTKEKVMDSEFFRLTHRGEPVFRTAVRKCVRKSLGSVPECPATDNVWDVPGELLQELEQYRAEFQESCVSTSKDGGLKFQRWSNLEAAANSIFEGLLDNGVRELDRIFEELVRELIKQELSG